jgi:hypothetical protein
MKYCALSLLTVLIATATLSVAAETPFALDSDTLASMSFEGVALPTTSKALLEAFPAAKLEPRDGNSKHRMSCYLVSDFPGADTARFYFCDDRLYQFEASYSLERLEKMGGATSLLRKLIKNWGPVDHAGESRWTWKRAMYSRRADFYAWPDRAKLTITELGLVPIVTARRQETIEPENIPGF